MRRTREALLKVSTKLREILEWKFAVDSTLGDHKHKIKLLWIDRERS